MDKFESLEKAMCNELEAIEKKLNGGEMTETDLKRIDLLAHAMKSLATYKAMKDPEEYNSRHGREERYMGRDDRYSGRYDDYPPRYQERRW